MKVILIHVKVILLVLLLNVDNKAYAQLRNNQMQMLLEFIKNLMKNDATQQPEVSTTVTPKISTIRDLITTKNQERQMTKTNIIKDLFTTIPAYLKPRPTKRSTTTYKPEVTPIIGNNYTIPKTTDANVIETTTPILTTINDKQMPEVTTISNISEVTQTTTTMQDLIANETWTFPETITENKSLKDTATTVHVAYDKVKGIHINITIINVPYFIPILPEEEVTNQERVKRNCNNSYQSQGNNAISLDDEILKSRPLSVFLGKRLKKHADANEDNDNEVDNDYKSEESEEDKKKDEVDYKNQKKKDNRKSVEIDDKIYKDEDDKDKGIKKDVEDSKNKKANTNITAIFVPYSPVNFPNANIVKYKYPCVYPHCNRQPYYQYLYPNNKYRQQWYYYRG